MYKFRSLPVSELTASGAGFIAGLFDGKASTNPKFQRVAGRSFFAGALMIGLLVPYLKPILLAPQWSQFKDQWSDGVCLQTSESSCGPACAATLVCLHIQKATEQEIARASYTSRTGTENWYLARTLRKRGLDVQFLLLHESEPWPFPSIAGVRLPNSGNSGHFIMILGRETDKYIIGDPLVGKVVRRQADLKTEYSFTGFFMTVK